jgi:hypothetical protein
MAGPNYVLDKGFKVAAGAANVEFGRWCKFNAGTTGDTVTTSGATSAAANPPAVTEYVSLPIPRGVRFQSFSRRASPCTRVESRSPWLRHKISTSMCC